MGKAEGLAEGEAKGKAEGEAKGKAEGERAKAIAIAENALKMNMPVADIARLTGMPVSDIEALEKPQPAAAAPLVQPSTPS
jgi:predicted transposase YdaD